MRSSLARIGLVVGSTTLSACTQLLTGPSLQHNPNDPRVASDQALFTGAQTSATVQQESQLARAVCQWMQQCAGQLSFSATLDVYIYGPNDFEPAWARVYGGGGLIDLRTLRFQALALGDSSYAGIAQVFEAWQVGTAADMWGDVPYSQAAQPTVYRVPKPDPQLQVYAEVEARLDTAIRDLRATGPTNIGPQTADVVYGGVDSLWKRLAYTLKARFYLHTAQVAGASAYQAALAAADSGLQLGEDYKYAFSGIGPEAADDWYDFQNVWTGYIVGGRNLVSLLDSTSDPRLALYFAPNAYGTFAGAPPGVAENPDTVSTLSNLRLSENFSQPLVTWAENQLIIAEATYWLDHGDGHGVARAALLAVRNRAGMTRTIPAPGIPGPGDPLMVAIITEKYIDDFQLAEVWNDWIRTCIPHLMPALGRGAIPRRIAYPYAERSTNPTLPPDGLTNPDDLRGTCPEG